jgi:hypothetical protein
MTGRLLTAAQPRHLGGQTPALDTQPFQLSYGIVNGWSAESMIEGEIALLGSEAGRRGSAFRCSVLRAL